MINDFHCNRVAKLIETAGGTIICGGKVNREVRHIEPTIILEPDLDSQLMKEEIFGPVMPVFPFKDIKDVIKFINERDKPLAVYYFGLAGGVNSKRVCTETSSGAFVCNEVITHINSHSLGFGGVGKSGYGRHGGFEGFKNFSNRKGLLIKGPAPKLLNDTLSPPFSPKVQGFLRKWMLTISTTNKSTVLFYLRILVVFLILIVAKFLFY